ncbi:MAG TPA: hypothetical protein VFG81_01255 [Anaerolineales bacterium]|jgi:hypothetical protein|nr:hypothetical protein [Anaerolineales bacterium]
MTRVRCNGSIQVFSGKMGNLIFRTLAVFLSRSSAGVMINLWDVPLSLFTYSFPA